MIPTRRSAAIFAAKAAALRVIRSAEDVCDGLTKHPAGPVNDYPFVLAESVTPLWSDTLLEETDYQKGKVRNLQCAAASLNEVALPLLAIFTFLEAGGPLFRTPRVCYWPDVTTRLSDPYEWWRTLSINQRPL